MNNTIINKRKSFKKDVILPTDQEIIELNWKSLDQAVNGILSISKI